MAKRATNAEIKAEWTLEQIDSVKEILEKLANGDTVTLGDFGDGVVGTDADEQAAIIRELTHYGIPKLYEM